MTNFFRKLRKSFVFGMIAKKRNISMPLVEKYREYVLLRQILEQLEIDCVLDVGANVGQFATDLRMIGFKGQIISFEPIREVFISLTKAMSGDRYWSGHQIALGVENGTRIINVAEDTAMSSLLEFRGGLPKLGTEQIKVRRLDSLWKGLEFAKSDPRIFLKIDTQGGDLDVFDGLGDCLERVMGLMSEISVIPVYDGMNDYKSSLERYESAGFKLCNLSTVLRTEKAEIVEMNCLMRR